MITAPFLLHQKLSAAGIPVVGVSSSLIVEFAPEATAQQITDGLAIAAAFDPVAELAALETATAAERLDLAGLSADITAELAWITGAIADIDTGLLTIDTAILAQLRVIVKGLMQIERRNLLEQRAELKAWRYVVRWLI